MAISGDSKLLPALPPDILRETGFGELHASCHAETMTSPERLFALYQAVDHVVANRIPGDFAECGVWRGGSAMMMALAASRLGDQDRRIWLYDTFAGMTAPTGRDIQAMSGLPAGAVLAANERTGDNPFWGIAPREVVEANLRGTGYPVDRFTLVEGDVLATLPAQAPDKLAILRLDTDWYESTRHELETLYPRLVRGGVLIVDDYGYWEGARAAVDEYFAALQLKPLLARIDFTGRMAIKP